MSYHFKQRLLVLVRRGTSETQIPQVNKAVIRATCKDIWVELVPSHIFNRCIMMQNLKYWEYFLIQLLIFIDIPDANPFIAKSRNKQVFIYAVPAQTIPLASMPNQLADNSFHSRQSNISLVCCHCCQLGIALTCPSSEYFAIMLYLLNNSNLMRFILEVRFGWVHPYLHLFQLGQSILTLSSWHWSASAELDATMAQQEVQSQWLWNQGSHWKVKVGQSTEWSSRKSQQQGASFFQILYSWFIIISYSSLNSAQTHPYIPPLFTNNIQQYFTYKQHRIQISKSILMIFNHLQVNNNMEKSKLEETTRDNTQLTIEKALEFAGDNSNYQKKRLLLMTLMLLSLAILNSKISMMGGKMMLIFLAASGIGQIICTIHLNILATTLGLVCFTIGASIFYPISSFMTHLCYLGMGFFGRGFFGSSLVYFNEIGGDRFRSWSIILVFAVLGISYLISSVEWMLDFPKWIWLYLLIFLPIIVDSYFILKTWKPSPYFLYTQRFYTQAKIVLNEIAEENQRPHLPYALEGETVEDEFLQSKKPTYFQILYQPLLREITIPLIIIWIYRQYIYYGSFLIIPQMSYEYTKNYILISISETVAVLMSYPIRLKIRRVNAIFGLILIILISSFICSFTVVDQECRLKGNVCSAKYIYRVSMMFIRFSIALIGNILINYTLEVYPSNVRNMAYVLLICVSSIGSILMPSVNSLFIHSGFSGFIGFTVASAIAAYFVIHLTETYGKMKIQKLQELENKTPLIQMNSWKHLNL